MSAHRMTRRSVKGRRPLGTAILRCIKASRADDLLACRLYDMRQSAESLLDLYRYELAAMVDAPDQSPDDCFWRPDRAVLRALREVVLLIAHMSRRDSASASDQLIDALATFMRVNGGDK